MNPSSNSPSIASSSHAGSEEASPTGWNEAVPPNGFSSRPSFFDGPSEADGIAVSAAVTVKRDRRNLAAGDPHCVDWVRSFDDPEVSAYRDELRRHNGIRGLEILDPSEVDRAVAIFARDGFVVVRDALDSVQLARMKAATERALAAILNIEYFAPWFRSESLIRSMPYEQWKRLSPHGRRISRYVMGGPGETIVGAGYIHPNKARREAFKAEQLHHMGTEAAAEYLQRH